MPSRLACALVAVATALAACTALPPPVHEPLLQTTDRTPVVLVPGATGVELLEGDTGDAAWGRGRNLLRPRDGGHALALSITDPEATPLEPGAVIEEIRLLGLRKPIYGPVLHALEANGYRRGDLADPTDPGATLFLFAYDWRRDNTVSAELLRARLESLREARRLPVLEVDLLCQSNGAYICRYLAKYGGAPWEDVEAGRARPPTTLRIRKILLVGTSNGGGLRILKTLQRGRRYVPLFGRRFRPEVIFTFRSLFQDLPWYEPDLFVDTRGRSLDLDLFDVRAWEERGWSVFEESEAERLDAKPADGPFADAATRRDYLRRTLDKARGLHAALRTDVEGFGPVRYYLLQSDSEPTPARAVVSEEGERGLLFAGDRRVAADPALRALASERGDGHATLESQGFLSPQEVEAQAAPPFYTRGEHFELILEPEALRRILEVLAE